MTLGTALLILSMWGETMTTTVVPASQCELLAKQFVAKLNRVAYVKAICLYQQEESPHDPK